MTAYDTLPFAGLFILPPDAFDCTSNVIFFCELTLLWLWLLMIDVVVVVTLIGATSIFVLTFFTDGTAAVDVIAVVFTVIGCWRTFPLFTPDCGERFELVALFERGFAVIITMKLTFISISCLAAKQIFKWTYRRRCHCLCYYLQCYRNSSLSVVNQSMLAERYFLCENQSECCDKGHRMILFSVLQQWVSSDRLRSDR